jgi:putative transcriptional regulator
MTIAKTSRAGKKTKPAKAVKSGSKRSSHAQRANRISEVVHATAKGFYDAGLMDKTTMREFDVLCLPKVPNYTPRQIQAIRSRCHASQAVFAAYMNITPSSLQKWETGARKPDNVAMKLLSIVDKNGLDALA